MNDEKITALILAAGRSTRMGAFKPLMPLRGQTVMEILIDVYRSAGISVLVVLGHRAAAVQKVLEKQRIPWVINEHYDSGMFSSIQVGVKNMNRDCGAFFLQPVDIPLIRPETLRNLIAHSGVLKNTTIEQAVQKCSDARHAKTEERSVYQDTLSDEVCSATQQISGFQQPDRREKKALVCYPCYEGRRGHPPLIAAALIPAILAYAEPGGMRALLRRYNGDAQNVECGDPGILMDLDTPEDYGKISSPPPEGKNL